MARYERHPALRAGTVVAAFVLLAAAGCTGGPGDTGTAAPAEDSTQETSGTSATDGVVFTDPEGRYTLAVPASWEPHHGVAGEGIEVWFVAEADATFAPNTTVVTEDVVGMSLSEYLELSIANAPNIISDFELLSSDVVTGTAGQELAVMESLGGGLQYLAVFGMGPEGAVIVTLTAPPDRFAAIRDAEYPYMLTLQPT